MTIFKFAGIVTVGERRERVRLAVRRVAWRRYFGVKGNWKKRRYWYWRHGNRRLGQVQLCGLVVEWRFGSKLTNG